jgi:hypothetical protein
MTDFNQTPRRLFLIAMLMSLVFICVLLGAMCYHPELPDSRKVTVALASDSAQHAPYHVRVENVGVPLEKKKYKLKCQVAGNGLFFDLEITSAAPATGGYAGLLYEEGTTGIWSAGTVLQADIFLTKRSRQSLLSLLIH